MNQPEVECDHGVTFDVEEARRIRRDNPPKPSKDPGVDFIMGAPKASAMIRKRFPRLDGKCPKGCGFSGIAYASEEHFLYGDW